MAIFNSYVKLPEANPNKEIAHASWNGIDPVMRVEKNLYSATESHRNWDLKKMSIEMGMGQNPGT